MDPKIDPTPVDAGTAYTLYADELLRSLTGRTGDRELAQDLVSEAFLRLAREERAGRLPAHVRGWLYRVAANLLASHGRHVTVARRELARLAAPEASRPSAETEVAAREALREALSAARSLAAGERRVLALAAAECSNQEMATLLGISPEAARTRLCRARTHLNAAIAA